MTSDPSSRGAAACRALILLGTLALASAGREARATDLTISNLLPMKTSPPYAYVTVAQVRVNVVQFTVAATTDWYSAENTNFGITYFTFNSDLTLNPGDITVLFPSTGWSPPVSGPSNAFGNFLWGVRSSTSTGTPTLVFQVNHTGATPADFKIANAMGHKFAANILNFTYPGSGVTSDWVTDSVGSLIVPTKAGMAAWAVLGGLGAGFVVCHKNATPLENREPQGASE